MNFKSLCAATALAVATAGPTTAAPIELNFDFGGVSVTMFGLDDALTISQQATSFDVAGVLDTYSGVTTGSAISNDFLFSDTGELTFFDFLSRVDVIGSGGQGIFDGMDLRSDAGFVSVELPVAGGRAAVRNEILATISITAVAPVPLPAGGFLLLSGIAGVAGLKRWKKRAA